MTAADDDDDDDDDASIRCIHLLLLGMESMEANKMQFQINLKKIAIFIGLYLWLDIFACLAVCLRCLQFVC